MRVGSREGITVPVTATLEPGTVALVGGGPGALDLITVRGLRMLEQADVVVVDLLGPRGLTELLSADVEVVDVGKRLGSHAMPQARIGELLVERARSGARVVRLKGGDPFLLGRGGEEVLACRAADIEVQVVPGVSSAIAGPAAGDVPVTHRGSAVALHVVNAHGDLGPADLAALRDPGTTTVLMMGVDWLPRLVAQALLNGVDPTTPVAVVQSATLPEQRSVHGTLATIEQAVQEAGIGRPAVIAVGRTAAAGFLEPPSPAAPVRGAGRAALPAEPVEAAEPVGAGASRRPVLIGTAHGTRSREGRGVIRAILSRVAQALPEVSVREAYVDVQQPGPAEVIAEVAPDLADRMRTRELTPPAAVLVPLLLSTGFHVEQDIGAAVAGRDVLAAGPLGPDPRLAEVMADRLGEAGATTADAVVMAVAGTRDAEGQEMAHRMGALLAQQLGREVEVGFLAAASPSVAEAIVRVRERSGPGTQVAVASYLLAPGHFHGLLAESGAERVSAPLGDHPLVADVIADRYHETLGG